MVMVVLVEITVDKHVEVLVLMEAIKLEQVVVEMELQLEGLIQVYLGVMEQHI